MASSISRSNTSLAHRFSDTFLPEFLLVSSVLVAFFLFFIDEGYYDLRWMESGGNWLAFFVYVLFLFVGQGLIALILPGKIKGWTRLGLAFLLGNVLGLGILVGVIFANV